MLRATENVFSKLKIMEEWHTRICIMFDQIHPLPQIEQQRGVAISECYFFFN